VAGFLWQVIRQALHRYFPAHYVGSARGIVRETAIEVGRLYELMSRIYFYSNQTIPILYTALRFLNEVEKAGHTPELASAYAGLAVLGGFVQLHPLAERYVERALKVAKEVNQPSTLITTIVVTGVYHMSVGKWDDIRTKAQEARELCEALGDYRQWGDAISLLGEGAYLSGKNLEALNIQKTLLEDGRRRSNPLHIMWGLAGVASNLIRLGQDALGASMFEEALQILEEIPNRAASINVNGQLALAYQRLGEKEKALFHANETLKLAEGSSPTNYALELGFAALAEMCFTFWEVQHASGKPDSEQLKSYAERALKLLRVYKNVFPIGQAYFLHYQGLHEFLTGKHDAALKSWIKGLEAAQKFDLLHEEGLIRVRLGAVESDPTKRADHFKRAIAIFETMGAVHGLLIAKEAAQKAQ